MPLDPLLLLLRCVLVAQIPQRFEKARLHRIAPIECASFLSTHAHHLLPAACREAVFLYHLLFDAVLQRGPSNGGFTITIRIDDICHFILVRLRGRIEFGLWSVVLPEVRVAAILEE